jgi:hypothetical protein
VTCVDSDRLINMRDAVARCDRGRPLIESGTFPSASGVELRNMQGQGARVQGWGIGDTELTPARTRAQRSQFSTPGRALAGIRIGMEAPAFTSI